MVSLIITQRFETEKASMSNHSEKLILEKLTLLIQENLDNPSFSLDSLSKELGISRSQLHRTVKNQTQLSITLFARSVRLQKAKELLSTTDQRISEIAYSVGIDSPQSFSKYFTDEFGISPTDFRKNPEPVLEQIPTNLGAVSIAVLPFVNMSNDPEQEYFSDGITEEIINVFAQIPRLKVAGRTSSFSFKNKNQDLRNIGNLLNVRYLLEGSVRKSGNKLRITAQLIEVEEGFHLYSGRWDRELEDIFDIQDEISLAILQEIKIKLLGNEKENLLKRFTNNPAAYQLYMQGRFHHYKFSGTKGFHKAIDSYEAAVALEPNYANAYAGIAHCYMHLWFMSDIAPKESIDFAKTAIQKALALDYEDAESHVADGEMKFWHDWDFAAAEKSFKKALALNPNLLSAHFHYGLFCGFVNDFDLAEKHLMYAQELDPFSGVIQSAMCFKLWLAGRLDESLALSNKNVEKYPNFWWGYTNKLMNLIETRQFETALPVAEKLCKIYPNSTSKYLLGLVYIFTAQIEKANAIVEELEERAENGFACNYILGQMHIALGEYKKGYFCFEKALAQHECEMLFINHAFRNKRGIKEDPHFSKFFKAIDALQVSH